MPYKCRRCGIRLDKNRQYCKDCGWILQHIDNNNVDELGTTDFDDKLVRKKSSEPDWVTEQKRIDLEYQRLGLRKIKKQKTI